MEFGPSTWQNFRQTFGATQRDVSAAMERAKFEARKDVFADEPKFNYPHTIDNRWKNATQFWTAVAKDFWAHKAKQTANTSNTPEPLNLHENGRRPASSHISDRKWSTLRDKLTEVENKVHTNPKIYQKGRWPLWNWDIPDAGLENHQAMTKAFKGIVDAAKNMVPEPEIGAGAIRRSKDHVSKAWPEASKYMTSNPTFRDRREYRTSEVGDSPWTVPRDYGNHGVHEPDSPNIGPHP